MGSRKKATVEGTASLHEDTVQRADEHAKSYGSSRGRRAGARTLATTTRSLRVNQEVMTTAKQLVRERPGTRIVILSETEVLVR